MSAQGSNMGRRGPPKQVKVPDIVRRTKKGVRELAKYAVENGKLRETTSQLLVDVSFPQAWFEDALTNVPLSHVLATGNRKSHTAFAGHYRKEAGSDHLEKWKHTFSKQSAKEKLLALLNDRGEPTVKSFLIDFDGEERRVPTIYFPAQDGKPRIGLLRLGKYVKARKALGEALYERAQRFIAVDMKTEIRWRARPNAATVDTNPTEPLPGAEGILVREAIANDGAAVRQEVIRAIEEAYPRPAVESKYEVHPMKDENGEFIFTTNKEQSIYHDPLLPAVQPLRDHEPFDHNGVLPGWLAEESKRVQLAEKPINCVIDYIRAFYADDPNDPTHDLIPACQDFYRTFLGNQRAEFAGFVEERGQPLWNESKEPLTSDNFFNLAKLISHALETRDIPFFQQDEWPESLGTCMFQVAHWCQVHNISLYVFDRDCSLFYLRPMNREAGSKKIHHKALVLAAFDGHVEGIRRP